VRPKVVFGSTIERHAGEGLAKRLVLLAEPLDLFREEVDLTVMITELLESNPIQLVLDFRRENILKPPFNLL
jgi:hypothetical protein